MIARSAMTSLLTEFHAVSNPKLLLWLVSVGVLTATFVLLAIAINDGSVPSQNQTVLDWVVGRDVSLLADSSSVLSTLTGKYE